jgi:hypothetical protein
MEVRAMARRRTNFEYESPIPDEELSLRMSSTAGRKLEKRLESVGWTDEGGPQHGEQQPEEA